MFMWDRWPKKNGLQNHRTRSAPSGGVAVMVPQCAWDTMKCLLQSGMTAVHSPAAEIRFVVRQSVG